MNDVPSYNVHQPPGRLLKLREVVSETSLARATIYRRIAAGSFPRPVPIGGGRVAWLQRDLEEWKSRLLADACG